MEKINIAEILKDCPTGMELDCAIYDGATFIRVEGDEDTVYPIVISTGDGISITLTKYGQYTKTKSAKCVIFPKGKTTWEGFQRPFKDGDVAVTKKGHIHLLKTKDSSYCAYRGDWTGLPKFDSTITTNVKVVRFATEEEKQKLFDAIKTNGYKWNAETKTLEKLIEPKFKVGDRIKHRLTGDVYKVLFVLSNGCGGGVYDVAITNEIGKSINIKEQDSYELVPNKFDISTLKPFESKVLVRSSMDGLWKPAVFGFRNGYNDNAFYIVGGSCWKQCIPYLNNEHLCGTTNDCDDFYKTWK